MGPAQRGVRRRESAPWIYIMARSVAAAACSRPGRKSPAANAQRVAGRSKIHADKPAPRLLTPPHPAGKSWFRCPKRNAIARAPDASGRELPGDFIGHRKCQRRNGRPSPGISPAIAAKPAGGGDFPLQSRGAAALECFSLKFYEIRSHRHRRRSCRVCRRHPRLPAW